MDRPQKKIGIMGGTFDPIHYGHLLIAENAADQFGLDGVWFMPAGRPPHKEDDSITEADMRCHMISLAIAGNPHFSLSRLEVNSSEINYTYKTLEYLKGQNPNLELYFIMGGDSLFYFDSWRHPERILKAARVLAAIREDWEGERFDEQIAFLNARYGGSVSRLNTPNFTISSGKIRKLVSEQKSIRYMLPDEVLDYIKQQGLYQSKDCMEKGLKSWN